MPLGQPQKGLHGPVARLEVVGAIDGPVRHSEGLAHQDNAQRHDVGRFAVLLDADVDAVSQEFGAVTVESWAWKHGPQVVAVFPELVSGVKAWLEAMKLFSVEHGGIGDLQFFKVRVMHLRSCIVPPCFDSIKAKAFQVHRKHTELDPQQADANVAYLRSMMNQQNSWTQLAAKDGKTDKNTN